MPDTLAPAVAPPHPVAAPAPAPNETDAKTRAGNYFVSNYPPYAYWRAEAVPEALAALARPPAPDRPLGIYLHIPFCRQRCHFCYFKVYTGRNARDIETYLHAAKREVELYAALPATAGRQPNFVYFGGGTPSYLSTTQLRDLTDHLKRYFPWDAAEEVAFECEPGTLNDHKLQAIRDLGVTRLSLGVENFSDELLALNGRAHRSKEIFRAYAFARQVGFPQINIDLIAGMMGETPENWQANVARTLELAPDSVTIYQMEVPHNTGIYRQMREHGAAEAPVADWPTKRAWVRSAFAALEAAGYTVGSAYTAVRDPTRTRFVYRDRLWMGADLAGIGVASFSHVNGTHYQNERDLEPYLARLADGALPLARALTPTAEERLIRELVLQLKLGHLRVAYFQQKFGVDLRQRFAPQFAALEEAGELSWADGEVHLTRDALLQVDRLLHTFFLPQHQGSRYS